MTQIRMNMMLMCFNQLFNQHGQKLSMDFIHIIKGRNRMILSKNT